jgi:hypothetical protein
MDLAKLKVSTVIMFLAGVGLLIAMNLSPEAGVMVTLTAKIVAGCGIILAFFGL